VTPPVPDRLARILESTRHRVDALDDAALDRLRELAAAPREPRSLAAALARPGRGTPTARPIRVIGEIKRRSPSAGAIYEDLDVQGTARALAAAGCAALSVLTEPEYFGGDLANLGLARSATPLPILRKDFIVDPRQVLESRAHGADAVLLLAAALDDDALARCREEAARWDLEVLAEAHGPTEVQRLLAAGVEILGLNARDLHSFEVDVSRVLQWAETLPPDPHRVVVAESGILSREVADRVAGAPVDAALVGEGLMRGGRPGERLEELFGRRESR
jgi:indole-3-glycerol phosphate synthase